VAARGTLNLRSVNVGGIRSVRRNECRPRFAPAAYGARDSFPAGGLSSTFERERSVTEQQR